MENTTTKKSQELFDQLGDIMWLQCNDAIDFIRRKYQWHIHAFINSRTEVSGIWAWEAYSIENSKDNLYAAKNEETYEDAQRAAIEATLEVLVRKKAQRKEERRHLEQIKSGECITRKEAEVIMEKALEAADLKSINEVAFEYVMKECKELLYYTTE